MWDVQGVLHGSTMADTWLGADGYCVRESSGAFDPSRHRECYEMEGDDDVRTCCAPPWPHRRPSVPTTLPHTH